MTDVNSIPALKPEECAVILFLDFDGVTHREGAESQDLFCRLPSIEDLLRRRPAVGIVISSTWRRTHSPEQLASRFSPDVAARILGQTPYLPDEIHFAREAECRQWMQSKARPWTEWVALDDRYWLFRPFCPNLIPVSWCGPGVGPAELAALDERLAHLT